MVMGCGYLAVFCVLVQFGFMGSVLLLPSNYCLLEAGSRPGLLVGQTRAASCFYTTDSTDIQDVETNLLQS